MPSRTRSGLRLAITATVALALALSLTGMAASADTVQAMSPVRATLLIQEPGTLVAKGVAVDIDVEYQCLPGAYAYFMGVRVSERFSREVAEGSAYVDSAELGRCSGFVPQVVTVRVYAEDRAFKPGTGLVRAELFGYDWFGGYFSVIDEREVKFAK